MNKFKKLWRWITGNHFIVVQGAWDNAYPCKVGKYMVYNKKERLVWETDLTEGDAKAMAEHLNKYL